QDVAYGKIALGVDSADERVEIDDFLLRRQTFLRSRSPAHSLSAMKGFEPGVDLLRQRAIRRNRHAFGLDIDVTFEGSRAFGVGHEHRGCPVAVLVRGKPNDMVGVASPEVVDLIEFDIAILGGRGENEMIEGRRNVTIVEERDQVVDVLDGRAASRNDDRFFRLRHFLDQNPVVAVGTCDFENGDTEFAANVDGRLVKRSCHRDTASFADSLYQSSEVLSSEARVERFLDVADIIALAEIPMDEAVDIA